MKQVPGGGSLKCSLNHATMLKRVLKRLPLNLMPSGVTFLIIRVLCEKLTTYGIRLILVVKKLIFLLLIKIF